MQSDRVAAGTFMEVVRPYRHGCRQGRAVLLFSITELPPDETVATSAVNYETRTRCPNIKNSLIFFLFRAMLNLWAADKAAQPVTP